MARLAMAAKAIVAAVTAGLGSLLTVLVGDVGFGDITTGQWVAALLVALTAGGGVYGITNRPAASPVVAPAVRR